MVVSHPIIGKDSSLSEFLERQDPPPRYFGSPTGFNSVDQTLLTIRIETVTKNILSNNSECTEQTTFKKKQLGKFYCS